MVFLSLGHMQNELDEGVWFSRAVANCHLHTMDGEPRDSVRRLLDAPACSFLHP